MTTGLSAVERLETLAGDVFDKDDLPLLLVLPGLFLFAAFLFYPIAYSVYLSFTNAGPTTIFAGNMQFVGLQNYAEVLGDPLFWYSMGKTWLFVAVSVTSKIGLAIGVALVLTSRFVVGRRVYRSLIIVPMGLPAIFTITIWQGIFSSANFGLANQVLAAAGFGAVGWLSGEWTAFAAYVVTEVWLAYPFMVIIIVSALQGVPEELHDAAKVDGAGYLHRFVHVTLPAIKRPVLFASILTAAASFQQFLIPFVFNDGGPGRTNQLLLVYGYKEAFRFDKWGKGAAIMVVTLLFIGAFMFLNVWKGRLAEGVDDA
ncbi:carbohydrate ABC transporter permease [Halobaculum sp. D14]|uniref:carbohydrate ABC transporter permease n=1 Tax=unclassified Halobaculum TaxID=2640896 RepID=UPI003EBFBC32